MTAAALTLSQLAAVAGSSSRITTAGCIPRPGRPRPTGGRPAVGCRGCRNRWSSWTYAPRDLAEIRVYHRREYLCRAVAPDIATATVSMKDLQAARNQRRRELRQHLTARRDLVDLLLHPALEPVPEPVSIPRASSSTPARRIKLYRED